MHTLLKLLAFACCVITAAAECTSSKYQGGTKDLLICYGSSITEVQSKLRSDVIAIAVSQSAISEIPSLMFIRNATTVEILNIHDCGVNHIANDAFRGLQQLKKLSLAYNNINKLHSGWFFELRLLEHLDVSYNLLTDVDPSLYFQLQKLQRLDLNDNRLKCIPTRNMENMKQLTNIRFQENPLTYICRAELTIWLKDHKVNYATKDDSLISLDNVLWQCLLDAKTPETSSSSEAERKMNNCVLINMFEQLTSVLGASPSLSTATQDCGTYRQALTTCLWYQNVTTNGDMLTTLLASTNNVAKLGAPQ